MTLIFADVSKWQGSIDWAKYGSKYRVATARASIGLTEDDYWDRNHKAMVANLDLWGAYHYLWPEISGAAQADYFLDRIGDPAGVLAMLDVEAVAERAPDGTITVPTVSSKTMYDFADRWFSRTGGHTLLVYAPGWFWRRLDFGNPDASRIGPLVSSRYVSIDNPDGTKEHDPERLYERVPSSWWGASWGGWSKATVLQFTSKAHFPGMSGNVDANAFRGTVEDLRAYSTNALPDSSTKEPDVDLTGFQVYTTPKRIKVPKDAHLYDGLDFNETTAVIVDPGRYMPLAGKFAGGPYMVGLTPDDGSTDLKVGWRLLKDSDVSVVAEDYPDATPFAQSDMDKAVADASAALDAQITDLEAQLKAAEGDDAAKIAQLQGQLDAIRSAWATLMASLATPPTSA